MGKEIVLPADLQATPRCAWAAVTDNGL